MPKTTQHQDASRKDAPACRLNTLSTALSLTVCGGHCLLCHYLDPAGSPSPGRGSHGRSQPGCTVLLLAAGRRRAGPSGQHDFAPRDLILRQPGALGRHSQGAMAVGRGETLLQSSAGDWPMSQCELSPAHVLWRHKPEAGMQPAVTVVSSDMWEASSRRETEPPSSALTPEEPLPGTGARPYSTGDSRRERA